MRHTLGNSRFNCLAPINIGHPDFYDFEFIFYETRLVLNLGNVPIGRV